MSLEKWEIKSILVAGAIAAVLPATLVVLGLALGIEWAGKLLIALGSLALFSLGWLLVIDPVENFFEKKEIAPKK